jgi:hypothetical protein
MRMTGWVSCVAGAWLTLLPVTGHANDRTVVVGTDNRLDGEALALRLKGLIADPDKIFAATGSVECGGVRATGQLTRSGNRVTSAAHTFFDESGRSRALSGVCQFSILVNGQLRTYPITPLTPALSGSTAPYATSGQHDWAVARLEAPVLGVAPYTLGGTPSVGQTIIVASASLAGKRSYSFCHIRELVGGIGEPREIRTDCTCADGMSGAAYLTIGPHPHLLGVHVGFRSANPLAAKAFSATHYTFGTSTEGAFRRAIQF